MTATIGLATMAAHRGQLDDVVLGSNHTWASRWSQRTGRTADIGDVDFIEAGTWSMGCNTGRIGPGTVGWIARLGDGINPPLCGFIVCTSEPALYAEVDGAGNTIYERYVEGRLHGGLWVPGDDITAAGWPSRRAPWGSKASRQFRNGETITRAQMGAILAAVPASVLRTVELEHRDVTGRAPWWA